VVGRGAGKLDTAASGGPSHPADTRDLLAHQTGQVPTLVQIWCPPSAAKGGSHTQASPFFLDLAPSRPAGGDGAHLNLRRACALPR
jgi:hypothetical protein